MTAQRPLFLVGFMGCGKTTCAEAIARRTGRALVDTDRLVEQSTGRVIERIFAEAGEAAFREAERTALRSIDPARATVVATGGGIFSSSGNRRWMNRSGITVWLDVSLEEVRRRVGDAGGRPLWRGDDPIALRVLFERRRAAYALCHFRVAVRDVPPDLLAERLVRQIL